MGWTFTTLKEFIDEREARTIERFDHLKKEIDSSLNASAQAVSKAEVANEKRFDSVNEFRAALSDQTNNLLPRAEFNLQYRSVSDRIGLNENRIGEMQIQLSSLAARDSAKKEGFGLIGAVILGSVAVFSTLISLGTLVAHIYFKN